MYIKKIGTLLKLQAESGKTLFKKIESSSGNYTDNTGIRYDIVSGIDFHCTENEKNLYTECESVQEFLESTSLYEIGDSEKIINNIAQLTHSQTQQDMSIALTEEAVNFLLMNSMSEKDVYNADQSAYKINNKGENSMGNYLGNQIYKGKLNYDEVIAKYPQFKNEVDAFLEFKLQADGIRINK